MGNIATYSTEHTFTPAELADAINSIEYIELDEDATSDTAVQVFDSLPDNAQQSALMLVVARQNIANTDFGPPPLGIFCLMVVAVYLICAPFYRRPLPPL